MGVKIFESLASLLHIWPREWGQEFHNLDSIYPRNATNQNYKQLALIVGFKKMLQNVKLSADDAKRTTTDED